MNYREMKKMSLAKHRGGGSWEETCVACGTPMTSIKPGLVEHFWDASDEEKEEWKEELAAIDTTWMDKNIGYDEKHGLVFLLGAYLDSGEMEISSKEEQPSKATAYIKQTGVKIFETGEVANDESTPHEEKDVYGVAIHRVCAKILERSIRRPLVAKDASALMEYSGNCSIDGQAFDWAEALRVFGVAFFDKPETNKEFQEFVRKNCMRSFIRHAQDQIYENFTRSVEGGGHSRGHKKKSQTKKAKKSKKVSRSMKKSLKRGRRSN